MKIANNIIRHYLKNVYFITGTAYAGKSTMVRMLAERYGMIHCGENYHSTVSDIVATPEDQPDICYLRLLKDWKDFVTRTPEEYERWIYATGREAAEFEVAQLLSMPRDQKIIVDTNIPVDLLREISDEDHVAVILAPQSMSVERFFDRGDPEKQFILQQLQAHPDPEWAMANYRACLEKINSRESYDAFAASGLFTHVPTEKSTIEGTLSILARHFGLEP